MPNPSVSRGYTTSARTALPPSAYYNVSQTDFGALGGAAPALAYNAGAGSLAVSTARAAITWITAQGESLPSAEATVSIAGSSGAFTITQPTVPTNGSPVVAWRVYSSSGGAGSALLNTAAPSTTQVQSNFVTTQGTLLAFPVATTAVQVLIYGTGQAEPAGDASGIQAPLPSISANSSADYFFRIPNSASLWRTQRNTEYMRPQGIADPTGIEISEADVVAPLYPGTSQSATQQVTYMVMNSTLYLCTTTGTTAATFIGGAAFNQAKGVTTTDGTVVWTSYGKAVLARVRITNDTGSAAAPVAQEYDFFTS